MRNHHPFPSQVRAFEAATADVRASTPEAASLPDEFWAGSYCAPSSALDVSTLPSLRAGVWRRGGVRGASLLLFLFQLLGTLP